MTIENEKLFTDNKRFGFPFKLQKQIIYYIISSKLWIVKKSCNQQYIVKY